MNSGQKEREQVRVFYSGRVQGVGFRITAKQLACGFEVSGTVRNMPDGSVELVAEGSRVEIDAFLASIRDSGLGPCIRREEAAWGVARGEVKGFEIVR